MPKLSGLASGTFSAKDFDFFDDQGPAAPETAEQRFADSRRGYVFAAHGRQWKVVNDAVGHRVRLITGDPPLPVKHGGGFSYEPTLFAALDDDGILTVSALSKHGAARAVGRPLWRENLRGKG